MTLSDREQRILNQIGLEIVEAYPDLQLAMIGGKRQREIGLGKAATLLGSISLLVGVILAVVAPSLGISISVARFFLMSGVAWSLAVGRAGTAFF